MSTETAIALDEAQRCAGIVARRLFRDTWPGGAQDVDGRSWHTPIDEITAAIARMPQPVLSAFARAIEDCESTNGASIDGGLLDAIGSRALSWLDMTLRHRHDKRQTIGSPTAQVRALGDALIFSDIIIAADAARGGGMWESWHEGLRDLWDHLRNWTQACSEAGSPVQVPELGYVEASEFERIGARVSIIGGMARDLALQLGPVPSETREVLRRHQHDPRRVLGVVAERQTLDAAAIGAVLDANAPAVAEGAL